MIRWLLARPVYRAFLSLLLRLNQMKKFLTALAFAPVAVLADATGPGWPTGIEAISSDVDSALNGAVGVGQALAQKVGPAVLQIGAAFLIVAVALFCYRLVVRFLAGSKRG